MKMKVMNYSQIRPVLDTGDLVLFSTPGLISGIIRAVSRSMWSHVGMIVRARVHDVELLLLWESTMMSPVRDVFAGKVLNGIQLVPLSVRLAVCEGITAVRRLRNPLINNKVAELTALRDEVRGRPYERNIGELFKAGWDGPFGANKEDFSSLFCSEAVAMACKAVGLAPAGTVSNELTPGDFSIESRESWVKEAYGEQVQVVWDPMVLHPNSPPAAARSCEDQPDCDPMPDGFCGKAYKGSPVTCRKCGRLWCVTCGGPVCVQCQGTGKDERRNEK